MYSAVFCHAPKEEGRNSLNFNPGLLLLNTQSLNMYKIDDLYIDICDYSNLYFLCFTEIWGNSDSVHSLHVNDFKLISFFCRSHFSGGGVAIFVKNNINATLIDFKKYCVEKDFEICALNCKFNNINTVLLNCYNLLQVTLKYFLIICLTC